MNDLAGFIQRQGWSFYGIADAENVRQNLKNHEAIFQEWFKKGFGATMDYLKRMETDRFDPDRKLPGVKSVIVLGAWYASDLRFKIKDLSKGLIARYAHGKDYHKVLKKKLIELSDFLKSEIGNQKPARPAGGSEIETYVSVDSGPTVDRALAESAGLGFFGKNSCLIDPSRGSYFFIASLYTNLDLPNTPKNPMPNCGNCQNCLKNCPTGALISPGVVDARRCIAYLTIENKDGIPKELRPKIGNRLFGCDACQEVCPFNVGRAHLQLVSIEKFKPRYGAGESLGLQDVLSIVTDEEFARKFAGTPLMRAKRRGLIRNACVVAGNSGDKKWIPYLQKIANSESDAMLKEHAEWGIKKLNILPASLCRRLSDGQSLKE